MSNEPNLLAPLVDAIWNYFKWTYDAWFGDNTFDFNNSDGCRQTQGISVYDGTCIQLDRRSGGIGFPDTAGG